MIKILIVEDDVNIAKTIVATVSILKYETEIVTDGKTATQKILYNEYDLVLLDVMLPEMSGFEVMNKVKHRNIPVIFLTAMANVTDKVQG
ncbi:MAG: response regulator [Clostridia bacterium]